MLKDVERSNNVIHHGFNGMGNATVNVSQSSKMQDDIMLPQLLRKLVADRSTKVMEDPTAAMLMRFPAPNLRDAIQIAGAVETVKERNPCTSIAE
jgi:hypothetical protein